MIANNMTNNTRAPLLNNQTPYVNYGNNNLWLFKYQIICVE
jgi:hypothetical protein